MSYYVGCIGLQMLLLLDTEQKEFYNNYMKLTDSILFLRNAIR